MLPNKRSEREAGLMNSPRTCTGRMMSRPTIQLEAQAGVLDVAEDAEGQRQRRVEVGGGGLVAGQESDEVHHQDVEEQRADEGGEVAAGGRPPDAGDEGVEPFDEELEEGLQAAGDED